MKKIIKWIIVSLLFLVGMSLLLYPLISNKWNDYRQRQLISGYEEQVAAMEDSIDYDREWERAHAYNDALLPSILPDSFAVAAATAEDSEYMGCLNLTGDGMMGIVEIPKIEVKLPIFHGTDEEVLEKAAGHLEGSSLPVGGENTHSVISAHRGLPSATLFTDLDRLVEGDHFLLHILNDTLCYEVDQITVAEPEQTEALSVEEGQDLVTLLTCTPYGVNSHRLLVRGHRVPYTEEVLEEQETGILPGGVSLHTNYGFWVIIGLAITGIFIAVLLIRDRHIRQRGAQTEGESQVEEVKQEESESTETKSEEAKSEEPESGEIESDEMKSEEEKLEESESGETESDEMKPEEVKSEGAEAEETSPEEENSGKGELEEQESDSEVEKSEEVEPEKAESEEPKLEETESPETKSEEANSEESEPEEVEPEEPKSEEAEQEAPETDETKSVEEE